MFDQISLSTTLFNNKSLQSVEEIFFHSSIRRKVTLLYKNGHLGLKKMSGPGTFINIVYQNESEIWSNIEDL